MSQSPSMMRSLAWMTLESKWDKDLIIFKKPPYHSLSMSLIQIRRAVVCIFIRSVRCAIGSTTASTVRCLSPMIWPCENSWLTSAINQSSTAIKACTKTSSLPIITTTKRANLSVKLVRSHPSLQQFNLKYFSWHKIFMLKNKLRRLISWQISHTILDY